ncbi:MAG TPA: TIGR02587 family membrane protein [Candidatus Limnocylindria bacterium]|nr:TIGR02587 family membrane protein [Candidatus Limnocylindria bacterium]
MGKASKRSRDREDVGQTARQLLRAVGGGLIIGLPLLFTMEMWFHSFLLSSWKLVVLLLIAFLVVIGYSALSGFRHERTWGELLVDSVHTMGIAAVVSALALLLLGRIDPDTGLRDAVGKIALQVIPVAFGVSLAGAQLAGGDGEDEEDQGSSATDGGGQLGAFARLFVGAGAALLFALNIAPTEEPMLLGVEAEWWLLLLVVAASIAMTLAIVFYADFRGGRSPEGGDSILDHPLTETVAAYAVSLAVSLLLLWSFGRTDGASWSAIVGQTVMLGFVAAFGAAAGRLLVGSGSASSAGAT